MLTLPAFSVLRPRALPEALDALADGATVPIAGGTDLVPNMKRGLLEPSRLVSLGKLEELRGIREDDDGFLIIGAATSLAVIALDARINRFWPAVARAAEAVASPQIRNVATLGGNLCLDTRCAYYDRSAFWRGALGHCLKTCGETCHVVPGGRRCVAALAADMPPVLIAHGAQVLLASAQGERVIPLESFYKPDGVHNTVRRPEELLVQVRLPPRREITQGAFLKVRSRRSIDFAALSIAAVVERERDGVTVRSLRLVLGALASAPRVIGGLDAIVAGRPLDGDTIRRIAEKAQASSHPLPNIDVDADWRRSIVPVQVRRALAGLV